MGVGGLGKIGELVGARLEITAKKYMMDKEMLVNCKVLLKVLYHIPITLTYFLLEFFF